MWQLCCKINGHPLTHFDLSPMSDIFHYCPAFWNDFSPVFMIIIIIVLIKRGDKCCRTKRRLLFYTCKFAHPFQTCVASFLSHIKTLQTNQLACVKTRLHDATKICTKIALPLHCINGSIFASVVWCTCRKEVERFQLSTQHSHVAKKTSLTFSDFVRMFSS